MDQPKAKPWHDKLSCFSPNFVEHDVGGQQLHFYPVSVGMAFKLRTIGRPLARSLAVLFGGRDTDHGTKDVTVKNEYGSEDRQIIIEPITEGLAKIRNEQRVDAIDGLVASLTDDANAAVVGEIIMDSLRETFPKGDASNPPPQEFMSSLPLSALGHMLVGVATANKDVFGPLTDQVVAAASAAVDRIGAGDKAEEAPVVAAPKPGEAAPALALTPETSG